MFCPKCAQSSPDDQKFCRFCGFSLHEIAPLLSQTALTSEKTKSPETKAKKYLTFKQAVGLLVVSFVLWIGLGMAQDIPGLMQSIKEILRFVSVAFFGLALSFGLYLGVKVVSMWQSRESSEPQLPKAKDLPAAKTTAALPGARVSNMPSFESRPEPVPSVTERTTDLLEKAQGSDG